MVSKKQSDYRRVDGIINSSRNVPPTEEVSANSPALRRTARKNAWGKQQSSISETPKKFDHGSSSSPSSRKSERLEKLLPSRGKKKSQTTEEQKTPPPWRLSERSNKGNVLNRSNLKRKWMDGRTYKALFGPQQGTSNGNVNDLETVLVKHEKLEEKPSSRYVEYWVPVSISTVQLEQYCAVLLANSTTLSSCSKNDLVGVMPDVIISTHKCCDHPYNVDPSLQGLLTKGLSPPEYLDVSIKASGKLQFLDTILSEIRNKGLRVLILFQYICGSGRYTTGDILDDFLLQRFGQDSYERVDASLPQRMKKTAVNKFNEKNSNRFVFLLDIHACQSSIKLSSLDGIIFFDSGWNPSFDLKALNQMSVDSSLKQIKIFRLYSPFTLQEKVLILAAQNVTLDNRLHNIERSTSHQLLTWGASYLFKKLDLFHDADTTCSDISLEPSILKDVTHEFLGLLTSHDEVHMDTSLIVKVKHSEGTYSKNIPLLGEQELQNAEVESQLFWANVLDGRSPKWKYPSGLLQRNQKRVNYSDEPNEASKGELVVRKKRKKTRNIPTSPSSELGRNQTEPIEKGDWNSTGLQPVSVTQSSKGEASERQQSFHLLLKSIMAKVAEVLQLSDDVKIMAGELLDYIIDNYHISWESESIFHAFQISLCWNAASLVKREIYKDKSLAMVKKHLNFSCTEEEANLAYWRMRKIKNMFLKHTHGLKEPNKNSKDLVFLTADGSIGLTLGEKGMESHFKEIKKSNEKNTERLLLQEKEIRDLENEMEQKREEVNSDYRMHVAVIRFIYSKSSMRSEKIKRIEEDLDRRMEELKQQEERCLKDIKEKHLCEMIGEMKNSTGKFEKLKSFSPADFSGDSALYGVKPIVVGEHVLSIGSESFNKTDKTCSTSDEPQLVSSGPKTCIDDLSSRQPVNGTVGFTLKPRGSSDIDTFPGVLNPESEQPPHCSSAYLTGIFEQSPLQLAPNNDLSSSFKVPSKSSSTVVEVSDSAIVTEVIAAHCQVDKAEVSDSIIVTEVIAAHCQVDKTSSVVIDEMRSHNDKTSPSTNSDKICCEEPGSVDRERLQQQSLDFCEEPGSVDRERLQQQSLDFSKSLSTMMEVCDSINATELVAEHVQTGETNLVVIDEMRNQIDKISQSANSNNIFSEEPGSVDSERELIAEHGQTDETSLVVIDEMRNQNDKISQPTSSNTIFCEEPGSIDRERQQHESTQVMVDSGSVFGPNDPNCDKLFQVELPLFLNESRPIDKTHGGEPLTMEMDSIIQQESLAGSTVIADLINMSGQDGQNCVEHIGNVDRGSSQQVSIAESQAGADSCNSGIDLHKVSDVVERTPTKDNTTLPPASIIAGSQAGVDSSNDEAGSTIMADLMIVSGRDGQNCGEHIGNVDSGSSQVSIAESQAGLDSCNSEVDLHRVSDVVERTPTTDNTILPPASVIAGSQAVADSRNNEADLHSISDAIETNTLKDNALLPPASVIAGSQTGANSSNIEADLRSVSDVLETTTPTNDALLPPNSVIAGSNEASGFAIQPNIDICSSIQVMTTSVQVVRSAVLSQETTQTPMNHHPINLSGSSTVHGDVLMHEPLNNDLTNIALPANAEVLQQQYDGIREECPNQLLSARDLRSFPSVNVSPLGQGTQLPMVIAQPRTSNLPNHSSFHNLLQIEVDRLSKEMEQLRKILNDKRSVIEFARIKELEEINKKYNAEINETETSIASNINKLYIRRDRVLKNKILAEGFCSKFDVRANGLSFINNMQRLTTDKALIRPTTNGTGADPSLTNSEIPIASSSRNRTAQQSAPIMSTIPVQASQSTSLASLKENLQVREVTPMANCKRPPIPPSPPTQSVLQSAPRVSNIPARAPHRASLTQPKKNLQVHEKISPIAPSPPTHGVPQSALVISNMRASAPRRASFIFPPIKPSPSPPTQSVQPSAPNISNCGIPPIAPSPPTQSALHSALVISNVLAKAPRGETFTFSPIKLQAGGATRLPAPHLHFKPSSYPVTSCNSSVRTNAYGIPDESLNPLLRPVGSIASSGYSHGLQIPRSANPATPTNFPCFPSGPSPRPTTPNGLSSVRPVIPTNPTKFGVAVQPEIGAPPVVVNEAACLSDNEDAGTMGPGKGN